MQRRSFLKQSALLGAGAAGAPVLHSGHQLSGSADFLPSLSLNAYSLKSELESGKMGLESLFRFAAGTGFPAVDLTAYFIQGYPEVPSDDVLYEIRRKAFRTGISLSGTGVRNDFTGKDPLELADQISHVKNWIVAASKMGAPNIRVFEGKEVREGMSRERTRQQVVDAFRECALFGGRNGVTVAFQNNGGIFNSQQEIIQVIKAVNQPWFGLMLDTYHLPGPDPYQSMEALIPYAVSWQIKEYVRSDGKDLPLNYKMLSALIRKQEYHGFLPLEILGDGDLKDKIRHGYRNLKEHL